MVELFSWAKEMLAEISEGGKFSLKKGTTGTWIYLAGRPVFNNIKDERCQRQTLHTWIHLKLQHPPFRSGKFD